MDQKKATPQLAPPSLSFITPTPGPSPAGLRATSDGSSVLPSPAPTRSRSDGQIRGKRKADAVEGESTPPKDKATAALDPRRTLFHFKYLSQNII
jgi:hypothetical protein